MLIKGFCRDARMNHDRRLLAFASFSLLVLLVFGTFLFQVLEGWSALDAFYFTGITMATIGYGDIVPHTPSGKIATVLFAFVSVGIALYSLNLLARVTFRQKLEDLRWLKKK